MPKINVFDKIWSFVLSQAFQSVTWQTDWLFRVEPVIFLREREMAFKVLPITIFV